MIIYLIGRKKKPNSCSPGRRLFQVSIIFLVLQFHIHNYVRDVSPLRFWSGIGAICMGTGIQGEARRLLLYECVEVRRGLYLVARLNKPPRYRPTRKATVATTYTRDLRWLFIVLGGNDRR